MRAVLPAPLRPLLEPQLPEDLDVRWFASDDEAAALAPDAEIGWFDSLDNAGMARSIAKATKLKWLTSIYTGIDGMPLDLLKERGVLLTNGAGLIAITIAEYVMMGMLTVAKGYRQVVHAQDRHAWLTDAPGKVELAGSKALLIGYGAIGSLIAERARAFGIDLSIVRRTSGPDTLASGEWRARLDEFDWVILAVPATAETEHMIGVAELSAMKPTATLINISRGTLIDQDALVEALREKRIGAAFLDVTTPEPLPAGHPLWSLDNAHVTMHLSGRSQSTIFIRATHRFLENLERYRKGEPLSPLVDYDRGY